ncbi:MAG TPA: hypothetical protein VMB81_27020 [Candidatus Sulfotelmatobacter sp.]|nr:hypothetical protein [Candidatus Sulfotelmatobacter sp.]
MTSATLHGVLPSPEGMRAARMLGLRRSARRAGMIGLGAALLVLAPGLAVAARLAYAAGRWPALHDALHHLAAAAF